MATITVRVDATVHAAYLQMRLADVRHLPVLDEKERLVGILSDRDVLASMGETRGRWVPVRDVMSRDVAFVRADTRACEATALMLDRKIGALPVVDRLEKVVGIITETDFLRLAHRVLGGDALAVDE